MKLRLVPLHISGHLSPSPINGVFQTSSYIFGFTLRFFGNIALDFRPSNSKMESTTGLSEREKGRQPLSPDSGTRDIDVSKVCLQDPSHFTFIVSDDARSV